MCQVHIRNSATKDTKYSDHNNRGPFLSGETEIYEYISLLIVPNMVISTDSSNLGRVAGAVDAVYLGQPPHGLSTIGETQFWKTLPQSQEISALSA